MKRASRTTKPPTSRPITISVYFERGLHDKLKEKAKAAQRSLSGHLRWLAEQDINANATPIAQ